MTHATHVASFRPLMEPAREFENIDLAKSYATEENLKKALVKLGFADKNPMIVRNRAGRYTAIFSLSRAGVDGGYIGLFAQRGFKTFA